MNLLANETSPYLRQHLGNPVDWMPWGEAAFAKARAENKPILLSIGYAACHWCHVMAHESFEDKDTAALMNRLFVNIKVDREERPDVDAVFQGALALMGQQGGWPLTMFLTPRAEPFWGGTYFPPLARHGLPGFREVLRGVHESYTGERSAVDHNVKALTEGLKKLQAPREGAPVTRSQLDAIGAYLLSITDSAHGGIGGAPKFPSLTVMRLLWDCHLRTGGAPFKAAVLHGISQMCQGGIYDHIGGGFCRYSVDAEWLVPHFEKMLYDNALFIDLLSELWRETRNPLFEARIRETAAWLLSELAVAEGGFTGFASSFDADSPDAQGHAEEGAYYVWRAEEVDAALGPEAALFRQVYDVTAFGNWEGVNIPNRLQRPGALTPEEEAKLAGCCAKLKVLRAKRAAPARDGKVLADWNGLAIAALARASFALNEPAYLKAAESAFGFVTKHMTEGGRLRHVFCEGRSAHGATLEDYANMAEAALVLLEHTGNNAYLLQAESWSGIVLTEYQDETAPGENGPGGGFFMSPASAADLPLRPRSADDGPTPSGNGTMVGVLARLALLTGKQAYAEAAERTAKAFSGDILQRFFPLSTLLSASDFMVHPVTVVLTEGEGRAALLDVLRNLSFPRLVVMEAGQDLPSGHPAASKTALQGKAAAYICPYRACLPPVTEAAGFREALLAQRSQNRQSAANDS
jgi:uncharacterized protein YyaL (SSP411 family)